MKIFSIYDRKKIDIVKIEINLMKNYGSFVNE